MVAVTSNVVVSITEIESPLVLLMNRLAAAAGRAPSATTTASRLATTRDPTDAPSGALRAPFFRSR